MLLSRSCYPTVCSGIRKIGSLLDQLSAEITALNADLLNCLDERDLLHMDQTEICDYITATLQASSAKNGTSRISLANLSIPVEASTC